MHLSIIALTRSFRELVYQEGDIKYAFEHFCRINSGKSESTKSSYDMFFSYLTKNFKQDSPCLLINKKSSEDFLLWLNEQDSIGKNTKYSIQKNFLKFLRFLFEYEYVPQVFIINKDVKVKAKVFEPHIFTDADRQKMLSSLDAEEKNGNFQIMIMMLMYTGLRPSDIINITTDQVDLEKMEMKFYSSKTNKWFIRPLHSSLKQILESRINEVNSGRLFNYTEVKNMGLAFRRYLKKIQLSGKGYNLRTFRKDFISRSQEAGISINVTSLLVGHASIKTTMTYYTKLSTKHLKDELVKLQ
jgi:integrase/recombinase XerD